MQAPLYVGQTVRLKPAAADSFGFSRAEEYRVLDLYTHKGYKTLYVALDGGSMVAPFNRVKASQVR